MKKSDFVFKYRVRNWREYNRALVHRGNLTVWVDEQSIATWCDKTPPGGRGRPRTYSDTAIECALVVKSVFHLSLRAAQGFLESVVRLMGVELPIPDYTTVCRRQGGLDVSLGTALANAPRHVVIDATGLKVFGAGEWYERKHGRGRGRRRVWRKLHLGVDETTKEIVAVDLTESRVHDSQRLRAVLERVDGKVRQVSGDKAYDSGRCYEAILTRGARPTIPPRRKARMSRDRHPPRHRLERDAVLRQIRAQGRYVSRTSSGATRQSLAENAVSRLKGLLGVKLDARRFEGQQVEALIKCQVLNRMATLGLPISERMGIA